MAKQMKVLYGSVTETITGKSIETAKQISLDQIKRGSKTGTLTDADRELVEDSVKSQCENEKDILKILFQTYASRVKKGIDTLIEVSDILKMVDKSSLFVFFTEHEVDMMKDALKEMPAIPESWAYYGDLFRQLKNPEFKEIATGKD